MAEKFKACAVEGCKGNAHRTARGARGWCSQHNGRWERHGDPLAGGISRGEPLRWLREHMTHDGLGCLIWPFSRFPDGYGQVRYRGRPMKASRVMCTEAHGEPPTSKHEAAHSCGRGHDGCVHPGHLRWDTPQGNCADRVAHGTENRGERQGQHKLTENDVRLIRRMHGSRTHSEIAEMFGVARATVSDLLAGRTWGWMN